MSRTLLQGCILITLFLVLNLSLSAEAQIRESGQMNNTQGISVTKLGLNLLPGPETTSVGFQVATGYHFNSGFSAALGTGFTFYHDPLSLVPIFLDGSYRFRKDEFSPYLSLKLGYSISILSDTDTLVEQHHGGLMLNPSIGVQFDTKYPFGWYISAGYHLDRSAFSYERWDGRTIETEISFRRFMAGVGLTF